MEYRSNFSRMILPILTIALAAAFVLAVSVGAIRIPPSDIIRALSPGPKFLPALGTNEAIVLHFRVPRVLLAGLTGSALAVSGVALQGLFKNPMADPQIIGVSSGASLGACSAILLAMRFGIGSIAMVPVAAFLGALFTVALVYLLARVGGKVPVMTLLLAGIAVGTLLSAFVSLLVYLGDQEIHTVIYWLMGGFSGRGWEHVKMILPYIALGLSLILFRPREMNLLLLGEEPAQHLGLDVERAKTILLAAASLLTAAAVSVGGSIGFVGLVVPHTLRLIIGPDHKLLLPMSALAGAAFLICSDLLARIIIAPSELPVGIITALFGAPFFISLLLRKKTSVF